MATLVFQPPLASYHYKDVIVGVERGGFLMAYSTVQYSQVQYSQVQYCQVQYSIVKYSTSRSTLSHVSAVNSLKTETISFVCVVVDAL